MRMRPNSITFKVLSLIVCAFILTTVSVLFIADRQLTRIIDESQEAVYAEKIEAIRELLYRRNERLMQTGLVEAYFEDFKEASLKVLRKTYYKHAGHPIHPFIIDINDILAAILGNINLALFDQDLKEKTKKLLSEAEKASIRAKELTQQLLTFSKGGEPVKEVSSLDEVIRDSADFILLGDKVSCRYDIPEDLWLVDIDKGQMSQVIQNIVLNAGHAMPEGGTISITCENLAVAAGEVLPFAPGGRFVKISIRDSGIGMPVNIAEKIFDPYFTTKHGGSGLGLAISQSIINKHNGHITVDSTPGVGSTFTIYLPCSTETITLAQESQIENKESSPLKVLIMDDEAIVRDVAKEMLLQLGHEAVLSADGEEAVQAYKKNLDSGHPFDLVIMDLTIPGGMGGAEAVQKILHLDAKAKVMVSSGYSNDPIMANCREYGFCAAIVKPYQLQQLAWVISQHV